MLNSIIDNAIAVFSPRIAAQRLAFRNHISQLKATAGVHRSMQQMFSGANGGYEAGKKDRLKGRLIGSPHENDVPRDQIAALRYRSWNLFRNCPQARKVTRTLGAKVVGRGLMPQSQATNKDGTPFTAFRKRAREVFAEFAKECDWRGKPGAGGQHLVTLQKTALRANLLSGGVLTQFHHLDPRDAKKLGLYVPLQIQLLHVDRLDESQHGDNLFYGLELDEPGRVIAYHVLRGGVNGASGSQRIPADKMKHLFAEEDIDQLLGSPWMGAALLTMDDRRSYESNELIAAEMGSCVVATYSPSAGQTQFGLQSNDATDLTDGDGNPITRLQTGMFVNTGANGKLEMVTPNRPNNSAGEFLSHLIRSEAVSMPGVKSSTLTGDYRNSSFSSERSADNDIWPEIEELQDWFSLGFCQPIYEECVKAAALAGLFSGVEGFDVADFNTRQRDYLAAHWQGPVARSINPNDDAESSSKRVKNATSTPQIEANMQGRDLDAILDGVAEFIGKCTDRDIPEEFWKQALGIEVAAPPAQPTGEPKPTEQTQDDAMANRIRQFSMQNSV